MIVHYMCCISIYIYIYTQLIIVIDYSELWLVHGEHNYA